MRKILLVFISSIVMFSCEEKKEVLELDFQELSIDVIQEDLEMIPGKTTEVPFIVRVKNSKGEAMANIPIGWSVGASKNTVLSGGGSYLFSETVTDSEGFARCWMKFPYDGVKDDIHVFITNYKGIESGFDSKSLAYNLLEGAADYRIIKLAGDRQEGKILTKSKVPIRFELKDGPGDFDGVYNYPVLITSNATDWKVILDDDDETPLEGNSVDGYTVNTDGNSEVALLWSFGGQTGKQYLYINVFDSDGNLVVDPPVSFSAIVEDLNVTASGVDGNNQLVSKGNGALLPFKVQLVDEENNEVKDYKIEWEAPTVHELIPIGYYDDVNFTNDRYLNYSNSDGVGEIRVVSDENTGVYQVKAHIYGGDGLPVEGSPVIFDYEVVENGKFTDPRSSYEYETIDFNGAQWFAENIYYNNGNGACLDDAISNCITYGVMYSWYEAPNVCPAGSHLPSEQEWQELELSLGMTQDEVDGVGAARGRVDDVGLLDGQWSGLNFKLGRYSGASSLVSATGVWTADEYNTDKAFWRLFGTGWYSTVGRFTDNKNLKTYVRCVVD